MTKKQDSEKGKAYKELRLLAATLLVTLGVYVAFPERGLIATLPLLFIFAFAAFFVYPELHMISLLGGGIALLYGVMANLPASLLFGVFGAVSALCGALCARAIRKASSEKKLKAFILFLLPLLIGVLLPLFFAGSPVSYLRERDEALSYLEKNYPDQTFSRVVFYFDPSEKAYRATVYYDNEGNTLSSDLLFASTVQDGYRKAYADYVLMKQKNELIRVFQEKDILVITDEAGLLLERSDPVPGTYGALSEKMLPLTHYTVTFREEKPERREFSEACAEALTALQEADVRFGKITFYGLDAGNVVYRCEVSFDTSADETLSFVTAA